MWVVPSLYPIWTYFAVLYIQVQAAPLSKHKILCGHPHEVTLPLSNSCISFYLFCETSVHVFTLIKLLAFILCIRNCNAAFPNQQQRIPVIVTKCIVVRCCALVLEKKNWAQNRNFVAKLPYFHTLQCTLHKSQPLSCYIYGEDYHNIQRNTLRYRNLDKLCKIQS